MFRALELIARNRIEGALKRGEFDDLPGKGQRQCFDDERYIPEDQRMVYRLMKNSGFVPEGISLRNAIAGLESSIATGALSPEAKAHAHHRLSLLRTRLESVR